MVALLGYACSPSLFSQQERRERICVEGERWEKEMAWSVWC